MEEDKGKDIKDRLKCGKGREVVARGRKSNRGEGRVLTKRGKG